MKVIKDMEQGLLMNYFGLDGRFYLSITIMTFFAFDNPNQPISEQKLWPFIQEEIGKEAVFDMGMPKPKGEILVWGRCFTPDGLPNKASQVDIQLGPIKKTLYVFGNRRWKKSGFGTVISDPEPFTEMPIIYERAFGGRGFDKNPVGMGINPVAGQSGEDMHPLPNIENPRHLIGSPKDRPEPAGLCPIDFTWPQRAVKLGTYDNKWFQEHWPFYPADMDWTYFNAAPEDQQMDVFFNGNEKILIRNMHKTKPVIESRLPDIRHRLFISQLADKNKPEGEKIFKEIRTHIDTVWLFPHAERGVVIYRGNTETADDEALDVTHLFVAAEDSAMQPKTIAHYQEEFKKRLDRRIPENAAAAMSEARKKLAVAAERMKDLPQEISDSIAAGFGLAPSPVRTHAETINAALALIDEQMPLLDAGEKRLLETKGKFSHITKIDTSRFQTIRQQLADTKAELQRLSAVVKESALNANALQKDMNTGLKKALSRLSPSMLREKGIDYDIKLDLFGTAPFGLWHERGMRFIEKCREELESRPEYLNLLINMGLRKYTIKRAWIGIHPVYETDDPALWGLPAENSSRKSPKELIIPPGLVVPCFDKAKLNRIRISSFRDIYPPPDFPSLSFKAARKIAKDNILEGSGKMLMVHGLDEGKPFVRVAYEFESILLHQELGGLCAVITMENPGVIPDDETLEFLKKAPQFLVLQYPDSQEPADCNIDLWKAAYPQAEPILLPAGTNLFEAKKAGVDIWQWVADALRYHASPDSSTKPKEVDINVPGSLTALIPAIDVPALIKKAEDRIMAGLKPEMDLLERKRKEMTDIARKTLESKGISAEGLLNAPQASAADNADPFSAMKRHYAEQFSRMRKQLEHKGVLTPDLKKRIDEAEKSSNDIFTKAAAQYEGGKTKLAREKIMPDWAKKLLSDAGIDAEDASSFSKMTREKVVERYAKNLGFAGKNLSGLDLSGLDLRGADMRKAIMKKTNMSNCNLDDANLAEVLAAGADFSKSSLRKANMKKGIFRKGKFTEANLSESNLTKALMSEADFSESVLAGAVLEKTLLEKTLLKKANLSGVKASQAYFFSADVSNANLSGADITKAMFLKSIIDETDFSNATVRSVHFIETKGRKANFSNADMYNTRIFNGSEMKECIFKDIKAEKCCWIKSDLSLSDFSGASINRGLIQECNLAGSNFSGVTARMARITKTDLSDVDMQRLNLFQGSLRKSKLVRTDLSKSNLYGVEFYRTGVGDTRFEGANLKMTKLYRRTDLLPEKKNKV